MKYDYDRYFIMRNFVMFWYIYEMVDTVVDNF